MLHPLSDADAPRFLADRPVVHLAGVGADGVALMRPLHTALLDGDLVFHGADGAKGTLVGQTVSVAGHEVVVNLPSWFFHPTRACPATTWYVAAEVRGVLRPVEALADKARALAALTARHQPEGGYAPITGDDPRYRAALERLAVWRVTPAAFRSRVKLGQHLPGARVAECCTTCGGGVIPATSRPSSASTRPTASARGPRRCAVRMACACCRPSTRGAPPRPRRCSRVPTG
ncbi:MAG: pyridoxamine 5'-phosphate oxidase family protein [Myxococcales bacterium]|nr:pyridoxamine 5'-phosphate oxidase family protein [Myxococcales bacterium]